MSSKDGYLEKPSTNTQQTLSLVFDVDKDGRMDFVIGSRGGTTGPSLVWYKQLSEGWFRWMIEPSVLNLEAGGTFHDVDNDGDLDIIAGEDYQGNDIWWWENPYPKYNISTAWKRHIIKNSGCNKHHDMMVGDFDGNGIDELIFWNQSQPNKDGCKPADAGTLFLSEIPNDAKTRTTQWPRQAIFKSGFVKDEGLTAGDIDDDGHMDIVAAGNWFKHTGGANFTPNLYERIDYSRIVVGDFIKGGRLEIIQTTGDAVGKARIFTWTGSNWVGQDLLTNNLFYTHSLDVGDVNLDGKLDIFLAEMRYVNSSTQKTDAQMMVLYGDGKGGYTSQTIATGYGNHESRLVDLDDDSDLDILGKPYAWNTPRLDVWMNRLPSEGQVCDPLGTWSTKIIDNAAPWRMIFIDTADLDGDGDEDIVSGAWWYRNPQKGGGGWQRKPIDDRLAGATSPKINTFNEMAILFDFDDDGDIDILGTQWEGGTTSAEKGNKFVWARNEGSAKFTILNNLDAGNGNFLQGVSVDRFYSGGRQVMLSWQTGIGTQRLAVPNNPSTQQWNIAKASGETQGEELTSGDIDRDGDPDLLLGTKWLRNSGSDGSWSVFTLHNTSFPPDRSRLAYIDGDNRIDAVVGYEQNSKTPASTVLAWYRAPTDSTSLWPGDLIANLIGPNSLDTADIDKDGDIDIITGEYNHYNPPAGRVFLFENVGNGDSWKPHLVATGHEHHDGTQFVDIDKDGDLDILSIGWNHGTILLYTQEECGSLPTPTASPDETATPTPETTPTPSDCPPPSPDNAILNPGFESGKTYWQFYSKDGKGNFSTTASNPYQCNLASQITMQIPGTNDKFYQTDINLQPKSPYRLLLAARSTGGQDVKIYLDKGVSPYTNYGINGITLDLTPAWQMFEIVFTTENFSTPVADGRLRITLIGGIAGETYFFDDFSLSPAGMSTPTPSPTSTKTPATPTETPTTSPAISPTPGDCPPPSPDNAILNPGFESGKINWSFVTNSGQGTFTTTATNPYQCSLAAQVSIQIPGTDDRFIQNNIALQPNTTYRLRLAGHSSTGRDVKVYLHKGGSPYTDYGVNGITLNLTPAWQVFEIAFTTKNFSTPVADGRLRITLIGGIAGETYFFDDFSLSPVGTSTPTPTPTDTETPVPPTDTPTPTPTGTDTPLPPTDTPTPIPTDTETPVPPTDTPTTTPIPTDTEVPTETPIPTDTATPDP
jgi:hypothetical protein